MMGGRATGPDGWRAAGCDGVWPVIPMEPEVVRVGAGVVAAGGGSVWRIPSELIGRKPRRERILTLWEFAFHRQF